MISNFNKENYFSSIIKRIQLLDREYSDIIINLSNNKIKYTEKILFNKRQQKLKPVISLINKIKVIIKEYENNTLLLNDNDKEIQLLVKEEIEFNIIEIQKINLQIIRLLKEKKDIPKCKGIILEIRSGTGGDEASIFAFKISQMYLKFSEKMKWNYEIITSSNNMKGGVKELIVNIHGKLAYEALCYEGGIHRVQRIPITESQGRIHTSACSVVVLPDVTVNKIKIMNADLRIDVYRSSGPGGQSVNTTDSAVRITHIPTGIVVQCQNEKSQIRNKLSAMRVLEARLYQHHYDKINEDKKNTRKSMIKSGDRSEKIRTYNFQQDRCTDHRYGINIYNLNKLFSGNMEELIEKLKEKNCKH